MNKLDFEEVAKHIDILNVAYHLSLEITDTRGVEVKAICPFCGYNKNFKIATLSLNTSNNKYCCSRCGAGGFSIGLYARLRNIDNKKAYRELLDRECFSINRSHIAISPINEIADIDTRDKIYRDFLDMLKLEPQHRRNLQKLGFFVPLFEENNKIQALSMHLDKPYNGATDIWFSSNGKINGTGTKNWISKSNMQDDTETVVLTDNLLLSNYIKSALDVPVIAFSSISNSYQILKALDNTNIQNIIFTVRAPEENQNLDYIIHRVFRDLIPLGYNLDSKYIGEFEDVLKDDFLCSYTLQKVA